MVLQNLKTVNYATRGELCVGGRKLAFGLEKQASLGSFTKHGEQTANSARVTLQWGL
jgi:hypothetical protein